MVYCPSCKQDKDWSKFYIYKKNKRSAYCKECARKKAREQWRGLSKEEKKIKRIRQKKSLQKKIRVVLEESSCVRCGESDPIVLVFHHREPANKTSEISTMIGDRVSWKSIKKEIDKCDVLCANCHMRVHYETGDFKKYMRS